MVIKEEKLAKGVIDRFSLQTGLDTVIHFFNPSSWAKGFDGQIVINKIHQFPVEIKQNLRPKRVLLIIEQMLRYSAANKKVSSGPPVLISNYLSKPIRETLRAKDIGYLDLAGNAFVRNDDLFIQVDGQFKKEVQSFREKGFFTPATLKLCFVFFAEENLINCSFRELEILSGTGKATISGFYKKLEMEGYLDRTSSGKFELKKKRELLSRWIQEYGQKLKPTLFLGSYRFSHQEDYHNWKTQWSNNLALLWGSEPAADLITGFLSPGEWTGYASLPKIELMKKFRLIPDEEKGNVHFYQIFWPEELSEHLRLDRVVPPVLVYADLILSEDPRNLETAEILFNDQLKGFA